MFRYTRRDKLELLDATLVDLRRWRVWPIHQVIAELVSYGLLAVQLIMTHNRFVALLMRGIFGVSRHAG